MTVAGQFTPQLNGEVIMNVAFLGLGTMGHHMARNVLANGHDLTVWNRTGSKTAELVQSGAREASTPRQAAAHADIVCLSLSTSEAVEAVVRGEEGILASARPGTVIVDFSTISPSMCRHLSSVCRDNDVGFLDAPVSGGPEGAESGTLTVMVGGDEGAFVTASPIFDAVGSNTRRVGPSGAGLGIKLINQMLVGVNLAGVLEAFVMAKREGIDLDVMFEVLKTSAGSSVMFTRNVRDFLMTEQYAPGFALKHLVKDIDLVLEMGKDLDTSLFTPAVAAQLFRNGMAAGYGDCDMSAAIIPMNELDRDFDGNGRK
jgi:3-hydroxyisobutyrate dehydrogenase-like beta-hydroxyacid dehydrogenase